MPYECDGCTTVYETVGPSSTLGLGTMKDAEFKIMMEKRRKDLGVAYKDIQRGTDLGYNTIRRVFQNPMHCKIGNVVKVVQAMGGDLILTIERKGMGDELEPEKPIEPITNGSVAE